MCAVRAHVLLRKNLELLRVGNGGVPPTSRFEHGAQEWVIDTFLCLVDEPRKHRRGEYDITHVLSLIDDRVCDNPDAVHPKLIPIAALFAGNLVCLDYRHSDVNPQVVLWGHERSEQFSPHVEPVAPSLDQFLSMLA